ncbi:MAG: hypothetical protein AB7F86_04590 [Bdellovibrionales bacterium]
MKLSPALTFITLILLVSQPDIGSSTEAPQETPPKAEEKRNLLRRGGDKVEEVVDIIAQTLDVALARHKYQKVDNQKSQAKITQVVSYKEGGVIDTSTDFALNLRLPNLEKKWQLRFTSYDEDEEHRTRSTVYQTTGPRREYGAGIGFFRKLGKVKFSFKPKLVLKDPLEMNYTLQMENFTKAGEVEVRSRCDLYAQAAKGTGEFVEIDARLPRGKWTFGTNHKEEYAQRDTRFTTNHSLSVDRGLTQYLGVFQSVSFGLDSRPTYHLDSITLSNGVGQEIEKNRLDYSFGPSLTFAKSRNFKGLASLNLNIHLLF